MTERLILSVATMALVTLFTRAASFLFFARRRPPAILEYVQRFLPPAVMAILVVSSFRSIDFASPPYGLPAIAAAALTAALHVWKRNALLSIVGGTGLYMILLRLA